MLEGSSQSDGLAGWLAAVLAVVAYTYLLERVRAAHAVRTFRGAREPWWFGYTRDAVGLIGATLFVLAYHLAGFAQHLALLLGALGALVVWGIHEALAEKLQIRMVFVSTLLGSSAVIIPTFLFPVAVARRLERLLEALF